MCPGTRLINHPAGQTPAMRRSGSFVHARARKPVCVKEQREKREGEFGGGVAPRFLLFGTLCSVERGKLAAHWLHGGKTIYKSSLISVWISSVLLHPLIGRSEWVSISVPGARRHSVSC